MKLILFNIRLFILIHNYLFYFNNYIRKNNKKIIIEKN